MPIFLIFAGVWLIGAGIKGLLEEKRRRWYEHQVDELHKRKPEPPAPAKPVDKPPSLS